MESKATLSACAAVTQSHKSTPIPEWKIRQILWGKCGGAIFLGIQEGVEPEDALIIFNPPGDMPTTLAVPLIAFAADEAVGIALVTHKIFFAGLKFRLAEIGAQI